MTWDVQMTRMLRTVIGDLDKTSYTDARLKEILVVAAQYTIEEADFNTTYTINIVTPSIVPDPYTDGDNDFLNLVTLKAACLMAGADVKDSARKAMSIKDGPSSIDGKELVKAAKLWSDDICGSYKKALRDYTLGEGTTGTAIVGPYTTEAVDGHPRRDRTGDFF